jgi:cbb3-type cytochrome oxidase subunit 3
MTRFAELVGVIFIAACFVTGIFLFFRTLVKGAEKNEHDS